MEKDWNGNKNSVAAMLGMKTVWHPENREPNDFYSTEPKAVQKLLEYEPDINSGGIIYECACGAGNLSSAMEAMGYEVVSTDLINRGYGTSGIDFLETTKLPDGCRCIITNPPYKYASEFILHSLQLLPVGGVVAMFLNISYLSGKARYNQIYKWGALAKVLVFSNRVHCYLNNEPSGHSSPVNYAWYIFKKGHTGLPVIDWLQI